MSENTKIQWAHHTFNPWRGCTKVSEGCAHCYAEANMSVRMHGIRWGKGQPRVRTSESYWREPLKWNRRCAALGIRERVFCASLADVFDAQVSDEWRHELVELIAGTPHLDWLLLTKRPENIVPYFLYGRIRLSDAPPPLVRSLPQNVWLGFSAENQQRYEERWSQMIEVKRLLSPTVVFCSAEPLLGPIYLEYFDSHPDWIIVGGESGPKARECNVRWIYQLLREVEHDQLDVRVFVKQVGANAVMPVGYLPQINDPKGGDPQEWPVSLRVREFPNEGLAATRL